jgi:Uma2 family endonuclease
MNATATRKKPSTIADLIRRLGGIDPERIRAVPPPGTATIADVEKTKLCELIDGTLVEKAMGWQESILAMFLGRMLGNFVAEHDLGKVSGADGGMEMPIDLVRIPDVAFVSWARLPSKKIPRKAVPPIVPDLAVEVLSEGNTPKEMLRKRKEYFKAGVHVVWMVDRRKQIVEVCTSPTESRVLTASETLDGGDVMPGFSLPVANIFKELEDLPE